LSRFGRVVGPRVGVVDVTVPSLTEKMVIGFDAPGLIVIWRLEDERSSLEFIYDGGAGRRTVRVEVRMAPCGNRLPPSSNQSVHSGMAQSKLELP
jgi:hypothetical protein